MITRDDINALCAGLPAVTHVVQWGGSDVWKVGGKVFAIISWARKDGKPIERPAVSFKVSELSYEILREQPGLRPAPYLASRGFSWIQMHDEPGLEAEELGAYLADSHRLVAAGLTKKARKSLGILTE